MKQIYSLVGMQFRGSKELVANMKRGETLTLIRDRDNKHDSNAVEVWHDGRHIAFIKATEVGELARYMDRGHDIMSGIFTVGGDRWPQVETDLR